MTASATLDMTKVLPASPQDNVNKTHSSDADNFKNVFENVSKNYDDKSSNKAESASKDDSVNSAKANNAKKSNDNTTEKNNEVKEKSSEQSSSDTAEVKTATNEVEKASADAVESAQSGAENAELSALEEKIADMVQKISKQLNNLKDGSNVDIKALSSDLTDLDSMIQEFTKQLSNESANTADANTNVSETQTLTNVQALLADLQQSVLNSQNLNIFTADAQSTLTQQLQSITADLNNLAKGSAKSENLIQSANLKIQTQAQIQTQVQTQTQAPTQAQTQPNKVEDTQSAIISQIETEVAEAEPIESPVIQADIANVQSDSNVSDLSKKNIKDALSKTSLTQEIIDKTDAKVVRVETTSSGSSDSGFLNNQNAQEQAVKLSLQTDASALSQTSAQTGFDKISQSVQAQTQQTASNSREISQSEILSQVNSKLVNFKSDESTKVTIILKPENLGKINLELITNKEGLSAHFTADSAQVKEALDKNLDGLKESLSSQGVNVNNVTVKVAETQKQDNTFSFDSQTEQNKQQQGNNKPAGEQSARQTDEDAGEESIVSQETTATEEKSVSISSHLGQIDYKI